MIPRWNLTILPPKLFINLAVCVAFVSGIPVHAQTAVIPVPPEATMLDENFVNVASGTLQIAVSDLAIGTADRPLVHTLSSEGSEFRANNVADSFNIFLGGYIQEYAGTTAQIHFGPSVRRFIDGDGDGIFEPADGMGGFLRREAGVDVYTDRDGTRHVFAGLDRGYAAVSNIEYPNGIVIRIDRQQAPNSSASRISAVTRSDGLMLKYEYKTNDLQNLINWASLSAVTGINRAFQYCNPVADSCPSDGWPRSVIAETASSLRITKPTGASHYFTKNKFDEILTYKPPTYASDPKFSYQHCRRESPYDCYVQSCGLGAGTCDVTPIIEKVAGVSQDGQQWTYGYAPNIAGHYWEYSSHPPIGPIRSVLGSTSMPELQYLKMGQLGYFYFELGNLRGNRITRYWAPGSNGEHQLTYDSRGNVLTDTLAPFDSSAPQVVRAFYPASCVTPSTCNKPEWTEDAKKARYEFSYDPVHGGITKEVHPLVGGIGFEKRTEYVQRYARFLGPNGTMISSEASVWLPSTETYCTSGSFAGDECTVANSQVVKSFEYGPETGPNNLWLRGVAVRAYNAQGVQETLRTCFTYDSRGNKISETQPMANLAVCP